MLKSENYDKEQLQVIKDKYSQQTTVVFYQDGFRNKTGMKSGKKVMNPSL